MGGVSLKHLDFCEWKYLQNKTFHLTIRHRLIEVGKQTIWQNVWYSSQVTQEIEIDGKCHEVMLRKFNIENIMEMLYN